MRLPALMVALLALVEATPARSAPEARPTPPPARATADAGPTAPAAHTTRDARPAEPPAPLPTPPRLDLPPPGTHIPRTMALLASATPTHRPLVKIAVYGQSISKQQWSGQVHAELVRRYPHAEIVFRNLSIGGFASSMLVRPLEHDVIPFYPDLVIFHVYGEEAAYETIVKEIRTRTAAEMMVLTDHLSMAKSQAKQDEHSWVWMPALAKRWGLELVDVRSGWIEHLRTTGLPPRALLADDVHLNRAGNDLMAKLVLPHLLFDPARPPDPHGLVREYRIGREVKWNGRRLALRFEGNRIDALFEGDPTARPEPTGDAGQTATVASPRPSAAAARLPSAAVRIDGAPPSTRPELYGFTRPNADANRDWPWKTGAVYRIDHLAPLVREDWTLRFTSVGPEAKTFTFDAVGSVTGFDGSGSSDAPFVSRSGRVVIAPGDWFIDRAAAKPHATSIRPGYTVTFRAEAHAVDTYAPHPFAPPGRPAAVTLAQGLPNGAHELVLTADGPRPRLTALRVYRPLRPPLPAARP